MAPKTETKIDFNSAGVRLLTQLPGISKTLAYRIVNHRQRHGLLTSWEEVREIKGFPLNRIQQIKERAELICREENCAPPRHLQSHLAALAGKDQGFTRRARATRGVQRGHDTAAHRPH